MLEEAMIAVAADLSFGGRTNPEYDRALAELVAECFPKEGTKHSARAVEIAELMRVASGELAAAKHVGR